MKPFLQRLRPHIFPRNSSREKLARFIQRGIFAIQTRVSGGYKSWINQNEPDESALEAQQKLISELVYLPMISVVIIFDGSSTNYLNQAVNSILSQTYQTWELRIITTGLSRSAILQALNTFAVQDERIQIESGEPGTDSDLVIKRAIVTSHGDFIGFLDQSDCLAPFALYEVIRTLNGTSQLDLIYSDEDQLSLDGKQRHSPIFKPCFSIDYLRSVNYIQHFLVLRKSLGDGLGWFRIGTNNASNYDLILRAVERARYIAHIPQVLYHRHSLATKSNFPQMGLKDNHAEILALNDHITRCGLKAKIEKGSHPSLFHVSYQLDDTPLVSIIIPNHEHEDDLRCCVESILLHTAYQHYEILIVENNSHSQAILKLYEQLQARDKRVHVIEYHQPFNYSEINNFAVGHTRGDVLLFLNNDTLITNSDWLECMLEYALRPDVGTVGAKLYYPNQLIQHAGVIVGLGAVASHYFVGYSQNHTGYNFNLIVPQNLSAVTAACMMMRRKIFDEIGGFSPDFQVAFGDFDLCLKIRQKDYLVVWTPYAELIHNESMTRGYEDTPEKEARFFQEANLLKSKWADFFAAGDPYYNPNLTLSRRDFSLRAVHGNQAPRLTRGLLSSTKPFKE
jgi:GT2 family glycosyltransferase